MAADAAGQVGLEERPVDEPRAVETAQPVGAEPVRLAELVLAPAHDCLGLCDRCSRSGSWRTLEADGKHGEAERHGEQAKLEQRSIPLDRGWGRWCRRRCESNPLGRGAL